MFFLDALKNSPHRADELFDKIDASMDSLKGLFDALLDVSKFDSGIVNIQKSHFNSQLLIARLENEYFQKAREKNLSLKFCTDKFTLYSDQDLLKRLIANLISNAIRYTDVGEVILTISKKNSRIRIEVKDTGIGISEKQLSHIFEEFYQVNNPERDRNNGLGLGLAIVYKLSQLLDLKIEVSSEINIGSSFSFYIEQGDANKVIPIEKIKPYQNRELDGKNILLIDDEIEILNAMKQSLSNWGCNVLTCESKIEALEKLESLNFDFDCIISDFRLRDNQTGIEVINSILDATKKNAPALLISGDTDPTWINKAHKSGYQLLHKPIKPAQLRLQLIKLLQTK